MLSQTRSFFISYSHADLTIIEKDLEYFDEHFFNYLIDKEKFKATDDSWIKKAHSLIFSEQCCGAIFYLSPDALKSDAVEKEIDAVKERMAEDRDFFVFAVILGGSSIPELIKTVYSGTETAALSQTLPLRRIAAIADIFPDDKIYIERNIQKIDFYYEELYNNLHPFNVISDIRMIESNLQKSGQMDAYKLFSFGRFYTEPTEQSINILGTNIIEERDKSRYVKLNDGKVYSVEPLKWIVLKGGTNSLTLISESVVESIVGNRIDEWLNGFFRQLAFLPEDAERIIGRIRTLTYAECLEFGIDRINPKKESFWLSSINIRKQSNRLMCINGKKINELGLLKNTAFGIKPVIEISI